jgi:hypothetical protein
MAVWPQWLDPSIAMPCQRSVVTIVIVRSLRQYQGKVQSCGSTFHFKLR